MNINDFSKRTYDETMDIYTKGDYEIRVCRHLRRSGKLVTRVIGLGPSQEWRFPSIKKAMKWVEDSLIDPNAKPF